MKKFVDVSGWQVYMDWDKLSEEFDGVIIKIGQGHRLDDMFISHVNNAVKYNMPYGIYYYSTASNEQEAIEEAEQVDAWLKEYLRGENPQYGIWYDVEDRKIPTCNVTNITMAFINHLWGKGYNYVGVYSSYNWFTNYFDHDVIKDVAIWQAQYNIQNDLKLEHPDWHIKLWQYSDCYSDEFPYDANIYYEEGE